MTSWAGVRLCRFLLVTQLVYFLTMRRQTSGLWTFFERARWSRVFSSLSKGPTPSDDSEEFCSRNSMIDSLWEWNIYKKVYNRGWWLEGRTQRTTIRSWSFNHPFAFFFENWVLLRTYVSWNDIFFNHFWNWCHQTLNSKQCDLKATHLQQKKNDMTL